MVYMGENLKDIVLDEMSQSQKIHAEILQHKVHGRTKFTQVENQMVADGD